MYDMMIKIFARDVCHTYNDFLLELSHTKLVNELHLLMSKTWATLWLGLRYTFVTFIIIVVSGLNYTQVVRELHLIYFWATFFCSRVQLPLNDFCISIATCTKTWLYLSYTLIILQLHFLLSLTLFSHYCKIQDFDESFYRSKYKLISCFYFFKLWNNSTHITH